ncbi:MAG: ribosomal protein S18-alanine N-acetyltransferase [Thermoplasmata archaeon]|nr:MAG: ribosomal protein S18-alanine N-acetyltransferase [Thermoplasmata archaeon]
MDLKGVLGIERVSFPNPWSPNMFEALHQVNPEGFYVAQIHEDIVAYGIVLVESTSNRFFKKRRAHLMNLAVHPLLRNQGIGNYLLQTIISNLKNSKIGEIYLEVRVSNKYAIHFYKKSGFIENGIIKGFYGDEDAKMMAKKI